MAVVADLRTELLRLVPDERRVNDGDSVLDQHAGDLTYHAPHRPDVVVFPESTDEVAAVLEYADAAGVPVVPFGAGTSLEGHVIPFFFQAEDGIRDLYVTGVQTCALPI